MLVEVTPGQLADPGHITWVISIKMAFVDPLRCHDSSPCAEGSACKVRTQHRSIITRQHAPQLLILLAFFREKVVQSLESFMLPGWVKLLKAFLIFI